MFAEHLEQQCRRSMPSYPALLTVWPTPFLESTSVCKTLKATCNSSALVPQQHWVRIMDVRNNKSDSKLKTAPGMTKLSRPPLQEKREVFVLATVSIVCFLGNPCQCSLTSQPSGLSGKLASRRLQSRKDTWQTILDDDHQVPLEIHCWIVHQLVDTYGKAESAKIYPGGQADHNVTSDLLRWRWCSEY